MKIFTTVFFLLHCFMMHAGAQQNLGIAYSRQNVNFDISEKIEFVGDVSGNHHLLGFTKNEKPRLFIFDKALELRQSITLPFVIPERADIRIIPFANYYFICISSWYSSQFLFWKIDAEGNSTNLSAAFENLLQQLEIKPRQEFQLMRRTRGMMMWFHIDPKNTTQNTLVMLQLDSMLNTLSVRKVQYDFKRDEEHLRQEILLQDKYLLVIKTLRSGSALELMKLNLSTGIAIKNSFYSSGFLYSQPAIHYDIADSSITVTAMLSDIGRFSSKSYVFMCRLNSELAAQIPVTIFKKQFAKSTSTNFLLVDHSTQWLRFSSQYRSHDYGNLGNIGLYQDYIYADTNRNKLPYVIRPVTTTMEKLTNWDGEDPGIRFSLLSKNFAIVNERHVNNTKDAYTIRPDQYTRFTMNGKQYMIVGQQFRRKQNGLLMVTAGSDNKLLYTDVRVNERRTYVLQKTKLVAPNSIIMPYLHKREAGLVRITIE